MQFEFKGQTYEVSEDNVIFVVDKHDCIASLEFREHVKQKARWHVVLTTRNTGDTDSKVLIESDDYYACRMWFNREKEHLVNRLIVSAEDAYRLKVSFSDTPTYTIFSVTEEQKAVEYYLRLEII